MLCINVRQNKDNSERGYAENICNVGLRYANKYVIIGKDATKVIMLYVNMYKYI